MAILLDLKPIDITDLDVMARTLYGTCHGEGYVVASAIGWVVKNRLRDGRWGSSIKDICKRVDQFKCWDPKDPEYTIIATLDYRDGMLVQYLITATEVLKNGSSLDFTKGANFFIREGLISNRKTTPLWYQEDKVTSVVKNYIFLRL